MDLLHQCNKSIVLLSWALVPIDQEEMLAWLKDDMLLLGKSRK